MALSRHHDPLLPSFSPPLPCSIRVRACPTPGSCHSQGQQSQRLHIRPPVWAPIAIPRGTFNPYVVMGPQFRLSSYCHQFFVLRIDMAGGNSHSHHSASVCTNRATVRKCSHLHHPLLVCPMPPFYLSHTWWLIAMKWVYFCASQFWVENQVMNAVQLWQVLDQSLSCACEVGKVPQTLNL